MAFPLLHLLVADAYAKSRPALARDGAYYLGAIAPDAIHMRPGITKEVHKVRTHLFAKGPDGLPEVMAYWYEVGRTPFDIGYGVHVITDRLWVGYYPRRFRLIGARPNPGGNIPARRGLDRPRAVRRRREGARFLAAFAKRARAGRISAAERRGDRRMAPAGAGVV